MKLINSTVCRLYRICYILQLPFAREYRKSFISSCTEKNGKKIVINSISQQQSDWK